MEVTEDDDVVFVTGDDEFDDLERRLSDGSISDEEMNEILDSWEGVTPEKRKQEESKAEVIEEYERRLEQELGDGFEDTL